MSDGDMISPREIAERYTTIPAAQEYIVMLLKGMRDMRRRNETLSDTVRDLREKLECYGINLGEGFDKKIEEVLK